MISWTDFWLFALPAFCCWLAGAWFAWRGNRIAKACGFTLAGLLIFAAFIIGLWVSLERPPMRTMGETRLWYSFFLPLVGLMTYLRWRYKWILSFSTVLALVFIGVNLLKPDIHNKTLMPALQSPWFVPHVIVYMFAYAMLGAATVMALYLRCVMGKRGLGTLLELGSQRNLGGHYLVLLPKLYSLSVTSQDFIFNCTDHATYLFSFTANGLVWY